MNKNRQPGFTLIELLLYIVIVSVLLGGLSLFFGLSVDSRVKNETINEVDQQGTFVLDKITQTMRNATGITAPAAGTTGNSITLSVPTGGLSPTVFAINSGVLTMTEGANPAVNLTSSLMTISGLTVKNLTRAGTPGVAQVSFTVARANPSGRNEYDYSKTFTTSVAIRP